MARIIYSVAPLHPHKIFIYSTAIFFLLILLSPFESRFNYSFESAVFFFTNAAALYFPILFYRLRYGRNFKWPICYTMEYWSKKKSALILLLNITLVLSVTGVVFRLVDKFYYRGFNLSISMADGYEMASGDGGSVLGAISAFLYPLSISSFVLANYIRRLDSGAIGRSKYLLILIFFFFPAFEVALFGKRGTIMTLVVIYSFTMIWFSSSSRNLFLQNWKIVLVGAFAVWVAIMLLSLRLQEANANPLSMLLTGRVTNLVQLQPWLIKWLAGTDANLRNIFADLLGLWVYFIHGVYEYFYLFDNFKDSNAQNGGYTFWIIHKFLSMVGLSSSYLGPQVAEISLPRPYVYTTLFGPLYIDFLGFSLLINLIIGSFSCYIHSKAYENIIFLPLYLQFACVIAFYPMVNMLTMFQGLYNIIAAIYFIFIGYLILRVNLKLSAR